MYSYSAEKFDLIFGIGENCDTSLILRHFELQLCSYPLDWVRGGTLANRIELLCSNFEDFFNKEDLKQVDNAKNPDTNVYFNKKNNLHFVHDFLASESFEKNYSDVKNKYQRRIERLFSKIEQSRKVLVVYIAKNAEKSEDSKKAENIESLIEKAQEKLAQKYKNTSFHFLYLVKSDEVESVSSTYDEKLKLRTVKLKTIIEQRTVNILGMQMRTTGYSLLDKVFKQYKLIKPPLQKLKNIYYWLCKLSVSLMPISSLKRMMKHNLRYSD